MAEEIIFKQMGDDGILRGSVYGEFLNPIKMALLHESDVNTKKKGVLDYLFNIEKSKNSSEATVGQRGFSPFMPKAEGEKAEFDSIENTYEKVIRHISFGKSFMITHEAASDAKWGLTTEMKRDVSEFMRSYYATRHLLAEKTLAGGTGSSINYGGVNIDTTAGDGVPLFSTAHKSTNTKLEGTQSNYITNYLDLKSVEILEEQLFELAHKVRCFKDDNGEMTGYTADTIIIPGNQLQLERMLKTIVGTENVVGSSNNDINTQYGNWNLVILPHWEPTTPEIMLMSREANETFKGNMFYDRETLSVVNHIDEQTRNLLYNGYARMGIGFNSWKHIIRATAKPST